MRPSVEVSTSDENASRSPSALLSDFSRSCWADTRTPVVRASASSRARCNASRRACSGVRFVPTTDADTSTTCVAAHAEATARTTTAAIATPSDLPVVTGLLPLPLFVSLDFLVQLLEGFRRAQARMQPVVLADLLEEVGVGLADRHL